MGYWLKSYTDILDDPKYFRLSTSAQLAMHECFLIAKKLEVDELTGLLPSLEEIAFHSRKPLDAWTAAMKELIDAKIIIEKEPGYLIKNYVKRQQAIPPEERMRQYRKKINDQSMENNGDETDGNYDCNDNATKRNGEKRREEEDKIREEKETEVDEEKKKNDDNILRNELISTFSKETGIPIDKNMKPDDMVALDRMVSVGVSEMDLMGGIAFMRNSDFPIVGIKSISGPTIIEFTKRTGTKIKKIADDYKQYTNGKYANFIKK